MTRARSPGFALTAGLATLAAAAAVGAFALASTLARPVQGQDRLDAVAASAAGWEKALALSSGAGLDDQAICARADSQTAITVDQQIQDAAGAATIALGDVSVRPAAAKAGGLFVMELKLRADGDYDAVTAFLGRLASLQPVIFADTVDLRRTGKGAKLDLTGRVLCHAQS